MHSIQRRIICFIDLSTFARDAEHREDMRVATTLDRYYELVGDAAEKAGGVVVKTIGDGALLVFPFERADDAATALLSLRDSVNDMLCKEAWNSQLGVKMHVGDVVVGEFGPKDQKRFDIVGGEVNITARLPTRSFALSAEMFRALSSETRALFKKHTAPVTYIPLDDRRPSRIAK
jgi:class 3 adenylate cyclase